MKYSVTMLALGMFTAAPSAENQIGKLTELARRDDCKTEETLANRKEGVKQDKALQDKSAKDQLTFRGRCGEIIQIPILYIAAGPTDDKPGKPPLYAIPVRTIREKTGATRSDALRFEILKAKDQIPITELFLAAFNKKGMVWRSESSPDVVKTLNTASRAFLALDSAGSSALSKVFTDNSLLAVMGKTDGKGAPLEVRITRAP